MTTGHGMEEIGAMVRDLVEAGVNPLMLPASAFAEEVELRHRGGLRMLVPGAAISEGGGRHEAMQKVIPDLHYVDTWVGVAADGVVAKWTMTGTTPDGQAFASPHCAVFHVRQGRVHMLDLVSDTVSDGVIVTAVFSEPGQNLDPTTEQGVKVISLGPGGSGARPIVAQKAPYAVEVVPEKVYWWCRCGRSKSQPLCDGSHAGLDLKPEKFTTNEPKTVYFCGCKQSANAPLCDGSHQALT